MNWVKLCLAIEMLREASLTGMDRSKMFEPDNNNVYGLVSFANKGVLDGTSYDEVCAKIKDVFINNYREKAPSLAINKSFLFIIHSLGWWAK